MQKQNKQSLRSNALKNYSKLLPNFKEEKTQKFITILLTVITLAFFGVFAINPTISTIIKLRKELDDSKFVDNKLQNKINNISALQKQYIVLQNDLPFILAAVPYGPEVPLLAAQIQSVAKNSNVGIDNFQTFEVEVPQKATPRNYLSYSFALSTEGTFNDLYNLLTSLSNMQRVISIELLSLTKKSASNLLELSIKGKAFFNP